MKKIATTLSTLLVAGALAGAANADLIISEYIEGSSNNKAVEIYNPTGAAVDMTAGTYQLRLYFNGAVTSTNINLTGTLAPGATYVVAHNAANATILGVADLATASLQYNGDDAVVLTKTSGTVVVDAFGQVGNDPGTEWGTGLQSTADNTLRRNPNICTGDTVQDDVFDPSIQWAGFATDTFGGLDTHTADCNPTSTSSRTWGRIKSIYR